MFQMSLGVTVTFTGYCCLPRPGTAVTITGLRKDFVSLITAFHHRTHAITSSFGSPTKFSYDNDDAGKSVSANCVIIGRTRHLPLHIPPRPRCRIHNFTKSKMVRQTRSLNVQHCTAWEVRTETINIGANPSRF